MNSMQLSIGIEYGAQRIETKGIRLIFGGTKSAHYQIDSKNILSSPFLSFDLVQVNEEIQIQKDETRIYLSPDILDEINPNMPKSHVDHIEIGILLNIQSTKFTSHQAGWFHRYLIQFLNRVRGIEYYSVDFHPTLRFGNNFPPFSSIKAIFIEIGQYLIKEYHQQFKEIENIQIEFYLGAEEVLKIREQKEKILVSRRTALLESIQKSESEKSEEYFLFEFDQERAPFQVQLISPKMIDPAGYLKYADFQIDNFPPALAKKYKIKKIHTEQINPYFHQLSYGTIERVEMYNSRFTLPFSPNVSLMIFPLPQLDGFAIMDYSYTGKIIENLNVNKVIQQYADGHQHSGVIGTAKLNLFNPEMINIVGGWYKIIWMNSDLKEYLKSIIPTEIAMKIATEKDIKTGDELRDFLVAHQHPLFVKPSKHASKPQDLAILLSELGKIKEQPLIFEKYTVSIPAPDGQEYQIELKNCRITADQIRIIKKNK